MPAPLEIIRPSKFSKLVVFLELQHCVCLGKDWPDVNQQKGLAFTLLVSDSQEPSKAIQMVTKQSWGSRITANWQIRLNLTGRILRAASRFDISCSRGAWANAFSSSTIINAISQPYSRSLCKKKKRKEKWYRWILLYSTTVKQE